MDFNEIYSHSTGKYGTERRLFLDMFKIHGRKQKLSKIPIAEKNKNSLV